MRLGLLVLPAWLLVTASGCSTVMVQRADSIATVGQSYAETLKKVNTFALDNSINYAANELAGPRAERNRQTLAKHTDDMKKRVLEAAEVDAYLNTLENYFGELEALVKDDRSEETAASVTDLADELSNPPASKKLSDAEKNALSGFSGYVAKQVHAARVEAALKRDAVVVAQAILISSKMLDEHIHRIELRNKVDSMAEYRDKIERPYLETPAGELLEPGWEKRWSDYVRTPPVVALLQEAKAASEKMKNGWRNILRGQYSMTEVKASLKNVRDGLAAISAINNARSGD